MNNQNRPGIAESLESIIPGYRTASRIASRIIGSRIVSLCLVLLLGFCAGSVWHNKRVITPIEPSMRPQPIYLASAPDALPKGCADIVEYQYWKKAIAIAFDNEEQPYLLIIKRGMKNAVVTSVDLSKSQKWIDIEIKPEEPYYAVKLLKCSSLKAASDIRRGEVIYYFDRLPCGGEIIDGGEIQPGQLESATERRLPKSCNESLANQTINEYFLFR